MNLKLILLPAFCLIGMMVYGQSAAFLEIAPDARSVGMGGIGSATSADAWSVFWNGAKVALSDKDGEIAYSYTPRTIHNMEKSRLHSLAGYYKITEKSALTAAFRHFSPGEIMNMKPEDYALDLGYSHVLLKGLSIGATIRYIHSDLDQEDAHAADAVSFDLSLYYQLTTNLLCKNAVWSLGAGFSNLGTDISYGGEDNKLPGVLRVGTAYKMPFNNHHQLTVAGEYDYRAIPSDEDEHMGAVGAEYLCYNILSLRAGYHWGDKDRGTSNHTALGIGLNHWHVSADFAYLLADKSSNALDETMRLTVGIDLSLFRKK